MLLLKLNLIWFYFLNSFIEVYVTYNKLYIFVWFDNLNICIYLWNHHHSQNDRPYLSLPKVSLCSFRIASCYHFPDPHLVPGNHWLICFLSLQITLHFLEFYINVIIQYILFCCWTSVTENNYWDSPLMHVSVWLYHSLFIHSLVDKHLSCF